MYLERTEQINMTQFQWNELDDLCESTIRLHLGKSIYFFMLECESAYAVWQKLCNTYEKNTASNKVLLMQKLFNLHMQESISIANHNNDFDSFFVQIRVQSMNMDGEMKSIFLFCSLPPSWDIFYTAISNFAPNGTLVYNDVTSSLLSKEIQQKSMGNSHHGEAHYVQRGGKQRKGCAKQHDASKDGKKDPSCDRSKSSGCYKNVQCHYCEKYGHMKKDCHAWRRDKGKGKSKDNDGKEEKSKSSVKIEEINVVFYACDAQDINMLTEIDDVFFDAHESLSLQSSSIVELLVSGEVSHTWIESGLPPMRRLLDLSRLETAMHVTLWVLVTLLWSWQMAYVL
ncbi:hypothetical protein L7F22_042619 [Adiantum nelumboides]|nr:hypothetical protein [Adiantum nelumboides]